MNLPPELRSIGLATRAMPGHPRPEGSLLKKISIDLPLDVIETLHALEPPWGQHIERALRYYFQVIADHTEGP